MKTRSYPKSAPASANWKPVDIYQRVTDLIVKRMEEGFFPWRKTWSVTDDGSVELPRNYLTGRVYSGINLLLLGSLPYDRPYYLTFKQVKQLGGTVRKNASGAMVVFWKVETDEEATERGEPTSRRFLLRYYYVFNIADVEGIDFTLPALIPLAPKLADEKLIACRALMDDMPNPPAIRYGNTSRACYNVKRDMINMPKPENFETSANFAVVAFHELIHSTGHPSRLNRPELAKPNKFGSCNYAKEELTAEIGACYLAVVSRVDITQATILDNSVGYLQNWLQALKNDKTLIIKAAGLAQKAADYVLGATSVELQELEEPEAVIC
ncbi:zincin-like metallopeptidase domain-containing protein [Nibrella saemangeumensis]|uniref:Zincin-like metallopeptidase domain-containing protein n=1 Tax=Nibrella saemangeumensis TaxID=1084526 RepID=A0ABP8N9P0_9BACT